MTLANGCQMGKMVVGNYFYHRDRGHWLEKNAYYYKDSTYKDSTYKDSTYKDSTIISNGVGIVIGFCPAIPVADPKCPCCDNFRFIQVFSDSTVPAIQSAHTSAISPPSRVG